MGEWQSLPQFLEHQMYIVTLSTVDNVSVLQVVQMLSRREIIETFPLTVEGCIEAGKFMYNAKQDSWSNSSSVDFPYEYGFEGDVRELMEKGYNSLIPVPVTRTEMVGDYEVCGNDYAAIAVNRNNVQLVKVFQDNDAFEKACQYARANTD